MFQEFTFNTQICFEKLAWVTRRGLGDLGMLLNSDHGGMYFLTQFRFEGKPEVIPGSRRKFANVGSNSGRPRAQAATPGLGAPPPRAPNTLAGPGTCKSGRTAHLEDVEEGKVRADKQNGSPAPHKRRDCSVSVPGSGGPSSALLKSVHNTLILSIHSNRQEPPRGSKRGAVAGADPALSRREEEARGCAVRGPPPGLPVSHRTPSSGFPRDTSGTPREVP